MNDPYSVTAQRPRTTVKSLHHGAWITCLAAMLGLLLSEGSSAQELLSFGAQPLVPQLDPSALSASPPSLRPIDQPPPPSSRQQAGGHLPLTISHQEPEIPSVAQTTVSHPSPPVAEGTVELDGVSFGIRLSTAGIELAIPPQSTFRPQRSVCMVRAADEERTYRYDLLPVENDARLRVTVDLRRLMNKTVELELLLVDAQNNQEIRRLRWSCFLPPDVAMQQQAAIMRQRVCPVSGRPLGSMGTPLPVPLHDVTLYVCSADCRRALLATGSDTLHLDAEFVVSTSTPEDRPWIEQQRICPVMDEPLGSMGPPIKVWIGDRPVFLCCRGCIKKLKAEPAKYVARLAIRQHERERRETIE
ncbi:MAG: hypothetical protein KatS3mg111_2563 [Pirellulaceae bacterium]|nr:MAG: hypothetical protein KatS3mg111_2563 [Pirellulaceae bacterium]